MIFRTSKVVIVTSHNTLLVCNELQWSQSIQIQLCTSSTRREFNEQDTLLKTGQVVLVLQVRQFSCPGFVCISAAYWCHTFLFKPNCCNPCSVTTVKRMLLFKIKERLFIYIYINKCFLFKCLTKTGITISGYKWSTVVNDVWPYRLANFLP